MYRYELAKCMHKICNQMLPNEIAEEHECTSNYYNFHTRQLDDKMKLD